MIRKMVHADRVGSWEMHLEAIQEALPIFAAAGHTNYLKSAYFYLQNMIQLSKTNPPAAAIFEKGFHVVHRTETPWSGLGCDLVIEQVLMRALKTTGGLTRGSGLTEVQRALWVLSMPVAVEHNAALQNLTNTSFITSEQHKEMHTSRVSQDRGDVASILRHLKEFSPFSADSALRNIVTGVTFDAKFHNVHDFFAEGQKIVQKLPGNNVFTFTCKRSDKVQTLATQQNLKFVTDKNTTVGVEPLLLFQRLIVGASNGVVNLQEALKYGLCPYPSALFESETIFIKSENSQIVTSVTEHFKKLAYSSNSDTSDAEYEYFETQPSETHKETENSKYVLDGGSLLHRVPWKTGQTYDSIAKSYAQFIVSKYNQATVVFDGYDENSPSIKDCTHLSRGRKFNSAPTINFLSNTPFLGKKEVFLANSTNKSRIIHLIGTYLESEGCKAVYAKDDADVDIVVEGIRTSREINTIVIGEDSDLFVLLLHRSEDRGFSLHFRSDIKRAKTETIVHNILDIRQKISSRLCRQLLFLHAFTGCDSTSHIHGVGKPTAFKMLISNPQLQDIAETFCAYNQTQERIEEAGQSAILLFYGGLQGETIECLRYRLFKEKVATSKTFVKPEKLPPTSAAVKFHALRSYFQIQLWMGRDLDACLWGWIQRNNEYHPKLCDLPPAPESLLAIIRCQCKKGCDTMRCTCKKMNLPCTDVCAKCQDLSCNNMKKQSEFESDSESENDFDSVSDSDVL